MIRDTAATGALELRVGAGTDAAHFIAAIPTVIIYTHAQTLMKAATVMVGSNGNYMYEQTLIVMMSYLRRVHVSESRGHHSK